MTSLSIARVTAQPRVAARPRARIPTIAKLGVAVVGLSASLVLVAAGALLISAFGNATMDAIDVLGALLLGAIAVGAVVEAIRLAKDASQL